MGRGQRVMYAKNLLTKKFNHKEIEVFERMRSLEQGLFYRINYWSEVKGYGYLALKYPDHISNPRIGIFWSEFIRLCTDGPSGYMQWRQCNDKELNVIN